MKSFIKYFLTVTLVFTFISCKDTTAPLKNPENKFVQNLDVSGLSISEKITISSGGQLIDVNSDGSLFLAGTSFPAEISGMPEIINQPYGKACSILPEVLENSINNNVRWVLNCSQVNYFPVSGIVRGLGENRVKLQINHFPPVTISKNGIFEFNQTLAENTPYEIKVIEHPENPHQLCSINHPRGTIDRAINNIEITCSSHVFMLSGFITGQKSGLTVENSNGDLLEINRNDYAFEFPGFIPAGANYTLKILTQPFGQQCYILNGHGIKINHNVSNVQIICNDLKNLAVSAAVTNKDKSLIGKGKYIHFWFYLDRQQIVYPVFTKTEVYSGNKDFNFSIPKGTWFVRSFIDMDDDNKPGIGVDFQSRLLVINDSQSTLSIPMEDTFQDSGFQNFNAFIINTSQWYQPRGGKCGGTYLKLESINFKGNKNHISSVYVLTPDNKTVELFDDGGCGDSFNNNASSYDRQSGDGQVSAGIDQSDGIQRGIYTFYYANYVTDKIHIVEDSILNITPLSSFIYLLNPTGAAAVKIPDPVFQWNVITGAASYEILLESTDHTINNYFDPRRFVKTNSYIAPFSLLDQKAYKVNIQAFDADIIDSSENANHDFDLVSQSPDQYFITDFTGSNSVNVTGKLKNLSGAKGSYLIYGDSNVETGSWESSVFLAPESDAYSLSIFKNSGKFGAMISGINVDESGYLLSNVNRVYVKWNQSMFFNSHFLLDLTWNKPLLLLEPTANERGMGEYPVFEWEDYLQHLPNQWSYILWITPYNSHGTPRLIGLENNRINFTHLNNSSYYNLTPLYLCTLENKNADPKNSICGYNEEKVDPAGLKEQTDWEWKVMVVPCSFQESKNYVDNDKNGRSDYIDCVLKTFSGEKPVVTESVSNLLSTY
ncbi:MAG: hypothetical protein OEV78_09815 [Spirochaetia bacterium]|nr:hypothetical protein [Spirochaetia bacterium]